MTKQFKMSCWKCCRIASEESKSDDEIDFNNNLDVVYEDLTDDEDLFWYAYIKNMFYIFCFLIKHIFFLSLLCAFKAKTVKY